MGISDDEITSICPGANETIFVSAGEIVYQVGKTYLQTFVKCNLKIREILSIPQDLLKSGEKK